MPHFLVLRNRLLRRLSFNPLHISPTKHAPLVSLLIKVFRSYGAVFAGLTVAVNGLDRYQLSGLSWRKPPKDHLILVQNLVLAARFGSGAPGPIILHHPTIPSLPENQISNSHSMTRYLFSHHFYISSLSLFKLKAH